MVKPSSSLCGSTLLALYRCFLTLWQCNVKILKHSANGGSRHDDHYSAPSTQCCYFLCASGLPMIRPVCESKSKGSKVQASSEAVAAVIV